MEIDFSAIAPAPASKPTQWKPPRHVFFGKKDPETGDLETEPVYSHQAFPAILYKQTDGNVMANIAKNQPEKDAMLADGWAETPAKFGMITAPSHEQLTAPKESKTLTVKK